jgi:signal peptidase II
VNLSHPDSEANTNTSQPNQGGRLPVSRYALFFFPAVVGATADLITKSYVFGKFFDVERAHGQLPQFAHWWYEEILGIQTSTNPGALFGFGKGFSGVFVIFSVVALIAILIWLFVAKAAWDRWLTFSLGLISGGIIGNFYDRIGLGYLPAYPAEIKTNVRDWILFRLEGVPFFDPWPNFNIADSLLVTGAVMLFIHACFFAAPSESDETAAADLKHSTAK